MTDFYCYAEEVPQASIYVFTGSHTELATLHVPEKSIEKYKSKKPWCDFGKIIKISENEDPTNIDPKPINNDSAPIYYFTIDGKQLNQPKKGLNIIRSGNGQYKKVIKK